MENTSLKPEYKESVALFIAKGSEKTVRTKAEPWRKKAELDIFPDDYNRCFWGFLIVRTNLLASIDEDNSASIEQALKQNPALINQKYMLPIWEVPEAAEPQLETFAHRAARKGSVSALKCLLENGADFRIKNSSKQSVFDMIAKSKDISSNTRVKLGKRLVDAGLTAQEIQTYQAENQTNTHVVTLCKAMLTYIQNKKTYAKPVAKQEIQVPITVEHTRVS